MTRDTQLKTKRRTTRVGFIGTCGGRDVPKGSTCRSAPHRSSGLREDTELKRVRCVQVHPRVQRFVLWLRACSGGSSPQRRIGRDKWVWQDRLDGVTLSPGVVDLMVTRLSDPAGTLLSIFVRSNPLNRLFFFFLFLKIIIIF